jgi:hypothetical protein
MIDNVSEVSSNSVSSSKAKKKKNIDKRSFFFNKNGTGS